MKTGLSNKLNGINFYDINHEMLFGETLTSHGSSKILRNTLSVAPPSGVLQSKQASQMWVLSPAMQISSQIKVDAEKKERDNRD